MKKTYKRIFKIVLVPLVIFVMVTMSTGVPFVEAATYYFLQDSWIGGESIDVAQHDTAKTGWTKYSSKDENFLAGDDLQLGEVTHTWEQTSQVDFESGADSHTSVAQTAGSVELEVLSASATSVVQTNDTTNEDGFNKTDSDFYSDATAVTGTGNSAFVQIKDPIDWVDGVFNDNCSILSTGGTLMHEGTAPNDFDVRTFYFTSFNLTTNCAPIGNNPLRIYVLGDVNISGTLDATANGRIGRLGGKNGGTRYQNGEGYFSGGGQYTDSTQGGGGAYGGDGGRGYSSAPGGQSYGDSSISILYGGSGGGGGRHSSGVSSGGGGAINIKTIATITLNGSIISEGGVAIVYWAGSGAGGAIKLEAPEINGLGSISTRGAAAIGSGATGGSGGGGRVYLASDGGDFNITNIDVSAGNGGPSVLGDSGTISTSDVFTSFLLYPASANYSSYIDSTYAEGVNWENFVWTKGEVGDTTDTSISFRVKTSADGDKNLPADIDTMGCLVSSNFSNGEQNFDLSSCGAEINNSHRYLWYKATLNSNNPTLDKTPKLEDVKATWISKYNTTGTYTSVIHDAEEKIAFDTASWNDTVPVGTSITIKTRSCADATCSTAPEFVTCTNITKGEDISANSCVSDTDRYIQYEAVFTTIDAAITPSLDAIGISYVAHPTISQELVSSKYDSSDNSNVVGGVRWIEDWNLPANTQVTMYLRTAATAEGLDTVFWEEIAFSTSAEVSPSESCTKTDGEVVCVVGAVPAELKDGVDDQFYQYKISLTSDGTSTPIINEITVVYLVNAYPSFDPTYGDNGLSVVQDSDGIIDIAYSIKDEDTSDGTYTGYVVPAYYYSLDDGVNWTEITTGLSAGATDDKTVLDNEYIEYAGITWDPKTMIDDNYSANAKIKVTINDGEAANNLTDGVSTSFVLDTTDPVLGSPILVIEANATPAEIVVSASDDSDFQMRLGLESDLSDGIWETYDVNTTLNLVNNPDTVYVQFKDEYDNISGIESMETIETPNFVIIQDVSNLGPMPSEFSTFLTWKIVNIPDAGFQEYRVMRSDDEGVTYALQGTVLSRTINYYRDINLGEDETLYYKVAHVDQNGNISHWSSVVNTIVNGTQDAGEGGGGSSSDVPTIDLNSIEITNVKTTEATISWETDISSNSTVELVNDSDGDFSDALRYGSATLRNNASQLGRHTVIVRNLSPETTYYFQLESGNTVVTPTVSSVYREGGSGANFSTLPGPAISNITVGTFTQTSAVIEWDTSKDANSFIHYSTNANLIESIRIGDGDNFVDSHSVALTNLSQNTTYYYSVESVDSEGNIAIDDNAGNYYSFSTVDDTVSPIISNIEVIHTTDTATIVWETDENATSQINYASDDYYDDNGDSYDNQTTLDSVLTRYHVVTINGLSSETTYHFRVISQDNRNNEAVSADNIFTLTSVAPVVSDIVIADITTMGATVIWTTNKDSDSIVEYITSPGGDFTNIDSQGSSDMTTTHSVALTDLHIGSTYYIRVKSTDVDGNMAIEKTGVNGDEFTTLSDSTPPVISNIEVYAADDSATVTWITDELANSRVGYATESYYDENIDYDNLITDIELVTSHAITLVGLEAETNYHFYIETADNLNNYVQSGDETFITKPPQSVTNPSPAISDIVVSNLADTGATISWNTDINSDSSVDYITNTEEDYSDTFSRGSSILTATHSVDLTDLLPGTIYYFKVKSTTSDGGTGTQIYNANFITTGESEEGSLLEDSIDGINSLIAMLVDTMDIDLLEGSLEEIINKIQSIVPIPAIEGNPKVEQEEDKVVVIWQTSKDASSVVSFASEDEYKSDDEENSYAHQISSSGDYTKEHRVIIPNLNPGVSYHIQAKSKSSTGAEAISGDVIFTTFAQSPEVITSRIESVTDSIASVHWTTNIPASSIVKYVSSNGEQGIDTQVQGKTELVKTHSVELENLDSGTTYAITVEGVDEYGTSYTHDVGKLNTSNDIDAPQITDIKTESSIIMSEDIAVRSIIFWNTNEKTDSRIAYIEVDQNEKLSEENINNALQEQEEKLKEESGEDDSEDVQTRAMGGFKHSSGITLTEFDPTMSGKHLVVLTTLESGKTYAFRIISNDLNGNRAFSDRNVIMTPQQTETVLDMIINTFQDKFHWVDKMRK